MSHLDEHHNLLDELAADAPVERMRARFDELIAEPSREPGRRKAWLAWAAAALIVVAGALTLRLRAPAPGPSPETRAVVAMLEAPAPFERLRGVNAAAGLETSWPLLRPALLERLERDDSVNVRLAALDALLERAPSSAERLVEALAAQDTAIVQAHLAHRLRRRQLLSRTDLERILERPIIHEEARTILMRLEDS